MLIFTSHLRESVEDAVNDDTGLDRDQLRHVVGQVADEHPACLAGLAVTTGDVHRLNLFGDRAHHGPQSAGCFDLRHVERRHLERRTSVVVIDL